jgi:hypothetical protein
LGIASQSTKNRGRWTPSPRLCCPQCISPRTKYTFGLWRLAAKAHNTSFGLLRRGLVPFFGQWTHIFMIAKAYKSNHHVMVGVSKVDLPLPGTRRNPKQALSKHTDHRSKHAWSIFQAISCCPCDPRYIFDISKYLQCGWREGMALETAILLSTWNLKSRRHLVGVVTLNLASILPNVQ